MKMVSAAKLKKAEGRIEAARPYFNGLESLRSYVAGYAKEMTHPFLEQTAAPSGKILLLLITSDKGLCGSFNANLIRKAEAFRRQHDDKEVVLVTLGRKGHDYFSRRGLPVLGRFPNFTREATFSDLHSLFDVVLSSYLKGAVESVWMIYAQFINPMKNVPTQRQILPIAFDPTEGEAPGDLILEPAGEALLEVLLPRLFKMGVFHAVLESYVSENGARMIAMENATSAAADMIDSLTLEYNKARQAAITKELLDIVGGAEAMK